MSDTLNKKTPGYAAYQHYLNTGVIYGMTEGAVIVGVKPENPMSFERFLVTSRGAPPAKTNGPGEPWSDELVRQIMRDNQKMLEKALEEGWIVGLYDFIRDRHKLPQSADYAKLRRDADYVRAAANNDVGLGAMHGALLKLAKEMMQRRYRMMGDFS